MTMAGGLYGLSVEKFFNSGFSSYTSGLESETLNKIMLVTDTYTPAFDTHDFRNDVTNEIANTGTYTSGGSAITTTELTVASPAATQMKFASADSAWTGTTTTARGTVVYRNVGTAATDDVLFANTFGSDVTTAGGTFTVQVPANGYWYLDYA